MAKQTPSLYSVAKTFFWFAVVSVLLTVSLCALVWVDYNREWKRWQKQFVSLKRDVVRKELEAAQKKVKSKTLEKAREELKKAEEARSASAADRDRLLRETDDARLLLTKARTRMQDLKQFEDSYKYYYEEYEHRRDPRAHEYARKLEELAPSLAEAKAQTEEIEARVEALERRLEEGEADVKKRRKDVDLLLEEVSRAERKLENLEPSLAKDLLNAPMLDFIAPTLEIQQVVLEDLQDDYHFARVQKVDRCVTCHLGIDQKGFEKAPQPFRTHPNLDLYLSSSSPHPTESFGCTSCHGGNGHSVSFKDSAHTPRDEAQRLEWEKKYGWKELEKWEAKMLPMNHVEAACAKCHVEVREVPRAENLNRGRVLAESLGCFGCHKVEGFENRWKVGPDLSRAAEKLDESWIERWLDNPKDFRASTPMPRIFNLPNTSSEEDLARNRAVIQSIARYLRDHSVSKEKLPALPVPGDAARGQALVKELGCLACHSLPGTPGGDFGPELSGLGSKTTPEWVYRWVKDPRHLSATTQMPNLRLSDQEAADVAVFLTSDKAEGFEAKTLAPVDPRVRDELILAHLQGSMRRSEAEQELAGMNEETRTDFLGKKSIAHFGCYGCHSIPGFEDAKPIGTELSDEGRKNVHQLDFGLTGVERTREGFIRTKLSDPRVFDEGRLRAYHEKLRMPAFNLDEQQVRDLTTFVLSLTQEEIPLEMQRRLSDSDRAVERGRLLVAQHNCAGCHQIDGREGLLRRLAEDPGSAPPTLEGEGRKVQEKWLHEFLREPKTIRPWLKVRMPDFGFTEEEIDSLVRYFTHLSGRQVSYHGAEIPEASPERLRDGKILFDKLQCIKCHQLNPQSAAMGGSFLAPDLKISKERLRVDWVDQWLSDPQTLEEGTMMPTFFPEGQSPLPDVLEGDAPAQIRAIRDYLYHYQPSSEQAPAASSDTDPKN